MGLAQQLIPLLHGFAEMIDNLVIEEFAIENGPVSFPIHRMLDLSVFFC